MSDETAALSPSTPRGENELESVLADYLRRTERGEDIDRAEMLAQHPQLADELRDFFDNNARFQQAVGTPPAKDRQHQPPSRVRYMGDYELLEEIGFGGMGVIFKARQTSLQRSVAVKMILDGRVSSADDRQRFRQEAEAAASLEHPGILPIYEIGEFEGRNYFSMKLVEGGSLSQRIAQGPLPIRDTARVMIKVARAVHFAHDRGILHRDLKPANILLDAEDEPFVTDFGLAKRLKQQDSNLTHTGTVLGTPSYMAPEQAMGQSRSVTTGTDIYGLGAILYAMLTGRAPFQAENVVETLRQVLDHDPQPPSLSNNQVDRDLETICLKCLQKDRSRRYLTAETLARDLERYLAGEPVQARPVGVAARFWSWCRRSPVMASVGSVAVLLLLVVAVGAPLAALLLRDQRDIALGNLNRAERAERETKEKLYDSYYSLARAGRYSREAGQRFEGLEALTKAARIRPSLDLRNAAIACMVLPDLRSLAVADELPSVDEAGAWGLEVASTNDGAVIFSQPGSKQPIARLWNAAGKASDMVLSPNGKQIAIRHGSDQATWAVWDWRNEKILWKSAEPINNLGPADWNASGTHFFHTTDDSLVVSDVASGKQVHQLAGSVVGDSFLLELPGARSLSVPRTFYGRHWSVALSNNAKMLALAYGRGVAVVDLQTQTIIAEWPCASTIVNLAWRIDDMQVAAASDHEGTWVWRVSPAAEPLRITNLYAHHVLQFTAEGTNLIGTGTNAQTQVADPVTGVILVAANGYSRGAVQADKWLPGASFSVRGFEVLTGDECRRMERVERDFGHCADFSSDGRFLAVAAHGELRLRDAKTMRELASVKVGGDSRQTSIMFAPDSNSVLTFNGHSGLVRWPIRAAKPEDPLKPVLGPPESLGIDQRGFYDWAICRKDGWLALSNHDAGRILVLDTAQPTKQAVIGPHPKVRSVSLSPDGRYLATGHWLGTQINIWDLSNGRCVHSHPTPHDRGSHAAFSPCGRWLLISEEARYELLRVGTWEVERQLNRKQPGWAGMVAFSQDGAMLAITDTPRQIRLVESSTGEELASLPLPDLDQLPSVHHLCFNVAGTGLYVAGHVDFYWDLARIRARLAKMGLDWRTPPPPPAPPTLEPVLPRQAERVLQGFHTHSVTSVAFSPTEALLASASEDGSVILWKWKEQQRVRIRQGHTAGVLVVAFSPEGKTLASGGRDGQVILWDVASGDQQATFDDNGGAVSAIAYSNDGETLLTAGDDKTIRVRDRKGVVRHELSGHQQGLFALAISADGKTLFSAGGNWHDPTRVGELKAWNLETRQQRWSAAGTLGGIWGIALSPDGKQLAAASLDHTIRIWDATTGAAQSVVKGHTGSVIGVSYAPNGKSLASTSSDGTVRLWNTSSWNETALMLHAAPVQRLAISWPENRLATCGNDNAVRIWRLDE